MFSNKSSNPFLSEKRFLNNATVVGSSDVMTVRSTMNKFGILFLLLLSSSVFAWTMASSGVNITPYVIGSLIVAFILAMVISFKPTTAAYLAPVYALLEGIVIGGISVMFDFAYKGVNNSIITQAVFLTLSIVLAMFLLYRFRIIRVTERVRSIIIGAVIGVAVFYLLGMVLSFFNVGASIFGGGGTLGIVISAVIVVIAAFSLLLDFDMIERGAKMGAPKYMEWVAAFGLLVTIVWIYIEVLKLVSRLSSNNKQ